MEMKEYLYLLRLKRPALLSEGPTAEEAASRQRHVDYVKGLQENGTLILAGRAHTEPERSFGLVVFRALDDSAAQAIMQSDPAVVEGLMTAELFEFPVVFAGRFSETAEQS
jgi:uncharacterized protein YciI